MDIDRRLDMRCKEQIVDHERGREDMMGRRASRVTHAGQRITSNMSRNTQSKAKAKMKLNQVTEEKDQESAPGGEVEKSPSEFEPELDDISSARSSKRRTKRDKTEPPKNDNVQETRMTSYQQSITLAPGVTKSITRQNYALPLPSNSHRHRGIPVYLPTEPQTPRLLNKPSPFCNHETIWTKSVANFDVLRRITKASSHNIGEGPIWELLEDRSWYKECINGQKRPIVYADITLGNRWKLLSQQ